LIKELAKFKTFNIYLSKEKEREKQTSRGFGMPLRKLDTWDSLQSLSCTHLSLSLLLSLTVSVSLCKTNRDLSRSWSWSWRRILKVLTLEY